MRSTIRFAGLTFIGALAISCGGGGLQPLHTPEQEKAAKVEEQKEDRDRLQKLKQKYGPDHPQVKQMEMELGEDPPAKK